MGARWQPNPASVVIPQARGAVLDPSTPQRRLTSKMIIDATRQFPEEGGPDPWPSLSRDILVDQYPGAFKRVDAKWDDYWEASGLTK
jgi:3-polyprenyl-4-hydroxybenzoate decarboxylase